MKKCIENNDDVHIALLQIRAMPLEPGLPIQAMLLFNCPIRGIMPIINTIPINSDNDEDHYEALVKRQIRNDKNYDAARNLGNDNNYDESRNYHLFSIGSTVAVQ